MSEGRRGAFQACSKCWWTIWPAEVRAWGHRTWPGDPIQGLSWCWCPLKGEQSQRKRSKYPQGINSPKAGFSLPRWTFWLLPGPASWAEHTCLHERLRPQIGPSVWGQLSGVVWAWVSSMGGWFKKAEGDYMSLYPWLDVVLWIIDDLVPCQSGSASQVHRHMVLADSPWAQTPSTFQAQKFRSLRAAPINGFALVGKRKLICCSKCITCLTLTPLVEY